MMRANGAAARQTRVKMAELRAWAVVLSSSGGKTFYRVRSGEKHELLCTYPFSPGASSASISWSIVLQDIKISRYQGSGKHCPEMTILRTGSWYAHCSCVCKLHFVHYSHQAGRKQFHGGSKWASGSRTRGNHGLTGTAMSSGFKQLSAQPSTCFVFFVVVCILWFVLCFAMSSGCKLLEMLQRRTRQLYVCGALHTVH